MTEINSEDRTNYRGEFRVCQASNLGRASVIIQGTTTIRANNAL
jgi:hypothetical protein